MVDFQNNGTSQKLHNWEKSYGGKSSDNGNNGSRSDFIAGMYE